MIQIKLTFNNLDEAIQFLAEREIKHDHIVEKITSVVIESQDEAQAPAKKARKAKSSVVGNAQPAVAGNTGSLGSEPSGEPLPADEAIVKTEGAKTVATDTAPQSDVNADDVREALKAYNGKNGMDKARELLKQFGAARITELKEKDYADFIEAASVAV